MSQIVDARGLSCPQPVLMTLDAIKAGKDNKLTIIVDNEASKENVTRAAESKGWKISGVSEKDGETEISIQK